MKFFLVQSKKEGYFCHFKFCHNWRNGFWLFVVNMILTIFFKQKKLLVRVRVGWVQEFLPLNFKLLDFTTILKEYFWILWIDIVPSMKLKSAKIRNAKKHSMTRIILIFLSLIFINPKKRRHVQTSTGRHPVLVYVLKFPSTGWQPVLVYVLKFLDLYWFMYSNKLAQYQWLIQ